MKTLTLTLTEKGADGEFFLVRQSVELDSAANAEELLIDLYEELEHQLQNSQWSKEINETV